MEKTDYTYYSTQRPVDLGTFPKSPDNPIVRIVNYDYRAAVEGGAFQAWGILIYEKPLTAQEQYDYELRPSRDNPDVRQTMEEQAQVVGPWEEYRRVPEEKRVVEYDPIRGVYVPYDSVTPERLNAQHNSARKFPVPRKHPDRPHKPNTHTR